MGTVTATSNSFSCTSGGVGVCRVAEPSGASVTLRAIAGTNSSFGGWFGVSTCGADSDCTLTVNAYVSLLAQFILEPTVVPPPNACNGDTWSNFAQTFFRTQCGNCHNWWQNYPLVKSDEAIISNLIAKGAMPQDHALDATEKAEILTWLGCGAAQ